MFYMRLMHLCFPLHMIMFEDLSVLHTVGKHPAHIILLVYQVSNSCWKNACIQKEMEGLQIQKITLYRVDALRFRDWDCGDDQRLLDPSVIDPWNHGMIWRESF